ncbi:MAG: hypothetical protein VR65_19400 [Desulfobulbaceae bacterium BRH_c16a]|nr:MAG: hypothetical protein VR65_19400 [Desulfobulbaceae bacterium BRH_c16a]
MNKGELIEKVAKDSAMSKADAEKVLNSILSTIAETVATGDKVTLIGFGTFSVSDQAARQGRNPQTGHSIQIAARKVVKFKAGAKLIDATNQ